MEWHGEITQGGVLVGCFLKELVGGLLFPCCNFLPPGFLGHTLKPSLLIWRVLSFRLLDHKERQMKGSSSKNIKL